jgi:hypothetical protein
MIISKLYRFAAMLENYKGVDIMTNWTQQIKTRLDSLISNTGALASIAGLHIGSGGVITHNSTSQTITVPATAKSVRLATKGGATNFGIDLTGNASATSPGYIPDECIDYYPIAGGSQTLKVYGTAGYCYYYFLG